LEPTSVFSYATKELLLLLQPPTTKVSWIPGDLRKDGTLTSRKSYRWAETDLAIWDTTTASNFDDGNETQVEFPADLCIAER
jgi:hypothetical protein